MIHDYSTGRRMTRRPERMLFAAAARDPKVAATFDKFATRQIGPAQDAGDDHPALGLVNARHALAAGRRDGAGTSGRRQPRSR